nr:MAG TPA: hypothetical protein [Bacteriophage sp.]
MWGVGGIVLQESLFTKWFLHFILEYEKIYFLWCCCFAYCICCYLFFV